MVGYSARQTHRWPHAMKHHARFSRRNVEHFEGVWVDELGDAPDAIGTPDVRSAAQGAKDDPKPQLLNLDLATRARRRRHLFENPGREIRTIRTVHLRATTRCEQSR